MKRSQISLEFLLVLSFIILAAIFLVFYLGDRKTEYNNLEDYVNKRAECMKLSNILSSVYNNGEGASAETYTNYVITIFNTSLISIQSRANVTTVENDIAVLASEAGETTQTFYDVVDTRLNPTWYKNCFSDINGAGCESSGDDVEWNLISSTLDDLIQNIGNYETIYLEDAHIQYNAEYGGKTYLEILGEWVAAGNVLILAEHTMCRENSGSYPSTSYRCNPPGSSSDVWDIFNHKIHQRGGNYGNDLTVIIDPDPNLFPNLNKDDTFDFEEDSYIEEVTSSSSTSVESESLSFVGGFESSSSCICSSPSNGNCMRYTGSTTVPANATWTSTLDGDYNIMVRYCGENDGDDEWWVYKNGQQIDSWVTSNNQPNWQDRIITNVQLSTGDEIKLSCDRGTSSSYCRSDYIELTVYSPGTDETADSGSYENAAGSDHNQGGYQRTALEDCPGSGSSRQCTDSNAWELGYDNGAQYVSVDFNATLVFNISELGIAGSDITSLTLDWAGCWTGGTSYCDNGDNPEFRQGTEGNFEVLINNGSGYERLSCVGSECEADNTILLGDYNTAPSWGNADAYNTFSFTKTSGFNDNYLQDDLIEIKLHIWGTNYKDGYEVWQEIDYAFLTLDYTGKTGPVQGPQFTVVAEYDDNNQPAIAYWEYGDGRVFYFGDFQVLSAQQEEYSGIMTDLIEVAYYFIASAEESPATCTFIGRSPFYSQLSGTLSITNNDNLLTIENETG